MLVGLSSTRYGGVFLEVGYVHRLIINMVSEGLRHGTRIGGWSRIRKTLKLQRGQLCGSLMAANLHEKQLLSGETATRLS